MEEIFNNVLDNAVERYEEIFCTGDSVALDEIKTQIVDCFVENAKEYLGVALHEQTVSFIDNYKEDVEEVNEPETFLYEGAPEELPFVDPEDDEENEDE